MIRINLLPIQEIKRKIQLRNQVLAFAASFVLVLVALAGVALLLAGSISDLKTEIKGLEQKRNSYRPILRQIQKLQKDKQILETKLKAIKQLKTGSQLTVRVLDEVANRTPTDRMWLNSLRISGNHLELAGVALDNATIAQYMKSLEDSPFFGVADLANASQTMVAGQKLKSFSLAVSITAPEKPAEKAAHEKGPKKP